MTSNKKLSLKYKRGTKAVDPPDDYVIEDFQGTGKRMSYGELRRLDPSKLDEDQRLFMIFADEKFKKEIDYQRFLESKYNSLPKTGIEGVLTFPQRMYMEFVQGYDPNVAKSQTPQESRLAERQRREAAYADELGEANQSLMGPLQYKKDLEDKIALYGPNDPRSIASKKNLEQVNSEIEQKKLALQQVKANPAAATAKNLNKKAIQNLTTTVKSNPALLTPTVAVASSTDTNRKLRIPPNSPFANQLGPNPVAEDPLLPYDPEGFKYGTQGVYAEGIQQVYVPQVPTVDTFGNVTSLAATGGQLGGPIGAGVGAVLGAGLSLFQAGRNKKIKRQAEQAERVNEAAQFTSQFETQDAMTLPTAQDGMQVVNTIPIEIEGGELILKRSDSMPDGQMVKTTYTLKTKVPKGRKHSEGGIIYNAEAGDIVIPANKAAMIEEALQRRDNMFIETEVAKLPTEGIKAKGGLNLGGMLTTFFKGASTDPNSLDAKPLTGFQQATQFVPGLTDLLSKDTPQFQPQLYRPDQLQFESVLPEQQRVINEQLNQQVGQINNLATGQQRQAALRLATNRAGTARREEVVRDNKGRLNIRNQNTQLNNQAQMVNNQAIDRATDINLRSLADDRDRRRQALQQLSLAGRDITRYNADVNNINRQNQFNTQLLGLYSPFLNVNTGTGSAGYTNMTPKSQPVDPVQSFLDQYLLSQQNNFVGPL